MADPLPSIATSCVQCGVSVFPEGRSTRPRMLCLDCRPRSTRTVTVICVHCSKAFSYEHRQGRHRTLCSAACRIERHKLVAREVNGAVSWEDELERRRLSGEETARRDALNKEIMVYRLWGRGFGRGRGSRKYQQWGERSRQPCVDCGKAVGPRQTRTQPAKRCDACRLECKREWQRTCRRRREALVKGARVETIHGIKVFERDGWVCHICGEMTDKERKGTHHPRAPEIDHVVPLSKGGEHSYANLACAHVRCNRRKSDKPLGQLRLVA